MKKTLILLLTLAFCVLIFSAYVSVQSYQEKNISKVISEIHTKDFKKFKEEVDVLSKLAKDAESKLDYKKLKNQVESTRLAYKAIEFIFDYYQTTYASTYINGAPLPKVSEYYEAGEVIQPSGLQALDEAVYDDYSEEALEHIQFLTKKLKERVDFIENVHFPIHLKTSQIIECLRSGMVRIFNLGLTGFDTPGSVNAIEESYISFSNMEKTFLEFEDLTKPKAKQSYKAIKRLFAKGKKY